MYKIVNDFPNEILDVESYGPYISLYQPTHRESSGIKEDIIRFKNLVRELEKSLELKYSRDEIAVRLRPLYALGDDMEFWLHSYDGIGVLLVDEECIVYKLQRPVEEMALVSDSFYIKPLIRKFQSSDAYQLLGLNRKEFKLFEGNRYGLNEVKLPAGTARTIEEVLGDDFTGSYLQASSSGGGGQATYHGYGSKKDELQIDIERFFRFVDRFVMDEYSKPSDLPLMLVALPEYHSLFKRVSHNPYLMARGVRVDFDSLNLKEMKERSWKEMEEIYLEKTRRLVEKFENSRANSKASSDLNQIVRAALEKKVDTILIEDNRVIAGKINPRTSRIEAGRLEEPSTGDILDDLAEMVFKSSGQVVVLPKERMPTETGAAAIYRY